MNNLSFFILYILCHIKSSRNQYRLIRFFGKASILPDMVFKALNELEGEGYIEVVDVKYTVKHYDLTSKGESYLSQNYNFENICSFVNSIDESGFYEEILTNIKNR